MIGAALLLVALACMSAAALYGLWVVLEWLADELKGK